MKSNFPRRSFRECACIGVIVLLAAAGNVRAQYNFISLTGPGATATYALGVSGGSVVGYYSFSGHQYGFLYNASGLATLRVPGTSDTVANGISGGYVVGSANNQGFLYNGSSFTTFTVPGSSSTTAEGISGANIVGYYVSNYYAHGFLYDGSSYITGLDVPGAADTYIRGISGTNMVGCFDYASAGRTHAFLYNGSSYNTNLDVPGAVATHACGISGATIVGWFLDVSNRTHGYVYNGSSYKTNLSVAGSTLTEVWGVSGTNIVGFYSFSSAMYATGFLGTAISPPALVLTGAQRPAGKVSVNLTWMNNGSDCLLKGASSPTGTWSTVSSPWTTNNGWVSTVATNSSPAQFYRLQAN